MEKLTISEDLFKAVKLKCIEKEFGWSYQKLYSSIAKFIDNDLKNFDHIVYQHYQDFKRRPSQARYRAAFGEKTPGYVSLNNNYYLRDLLSYYATGCSHKEFSLIVKPVLLSESENPQEENTSLITASFRYIQILNSDFWDKYIIPDPDERNAKLSRFFTHANSALAPYAIAAGESVEFSDIFSVNDSDNNLEERTLGQILDIARLDSLSLIKIVGDGGIGKTTLLFSLAFNYHKSHTFIFIEQFDKETFDLIIDDVKKLMDHTTHPIIFLIDNVAEEDIAPILPRFVKEIKKIQFPAGIIFIVAERANRYIYQFEDEEFEELFNGGVQTLQHLPFDITAIFDKIYSWLVKKYPQLEDDHVREASTTIFVNSTLTGISKRTFLLIRSLNLNQKFHYDFDWIDWDEFVKATPEFVDLKYLFIIVACFYQFGIKLNISFKSSFLKQTGRLEILRAIGNLGIEKSPIALRDNNSFLALNHEDIATWFCSDKKNQILVQGFFRDFLSEINDEISAKLIRKIRKASRFPDFAESCIANDFTPEIYLRVINRYLNKNDISAEERVKMLNEQGMTLLILEKHSEAIESFKKAIAIDEGNNHARDQLARLYLRNPSTYQLAFDKYFEIYKNNGEYALVKIYKLLQHSKEANITIEYSHEIELEDDELYPFIKKCLIKGEIAFAENILLKIDNFNLKTAECFNWLAHRMPFSDETIKRKEGYYTKAMEINNAISDNNQEYIFEVDYAVFLYRICEFKKGSVIINNLNTRLSDTHKIAAELLFKNKIKILTKLFFTNLPPREATDEFKVFLEAKSKKAIGWIGEAQPQVSAVIKGLQILHTVHFHSRGVLDNLHYATCLHLANCYTNHATKDINNMSILERRSIAEWCYEAAYNSGMKFDLKSATNMINNLLQFGHVKAKKTIQIIENFLLYPMFFNNPDIYRYRGYARQLIGSYYEAMADYEFSSELMKHYDYRNIVIYNMVKSYVLHNMARLIFLCKIKGVYLSGYSMKRAEQLCLQALTLNPSLKYAQETLILIRKLNKR